VGFVPTRDHLDAPLEPERLATLVRVVAETLAWISLGYPEKDFLEDGNPWRELDQTLQEELSPRTCLRCGRAKYQSPEGDWMCSGCRRYTGDCRCVPVGDV
jgi:hypothetical protein